MSWFDANMSHVTNLFVTGHGPFKYKLHSLGLASSPACTCGSLEQDSEHILWDCPHMAAEREEVFNRVRESRPNGAIGPVGHGDLVGSVVSLKALQTFAAAYVKFAAAQPR